MGMLPEDWQAMTPEDQRKWIEHLRRMAKPDEMIELIRKYHASEGTDGFGEASDELAHQIRNDSFSIYGRWVAWRHRGVVYSVVQFPDGEYTELATTVVPPELIVNGKTPDGLDVVDLASDPTYAMN